MSGARWKQFIGAPGARSAAGAKARGRPPFAASGQADSCGLTGRARPLYSAGFATSACRLMFEGPCGGIGRRARLKIEFRKECWFDSGQGHQGIRVATAATQQNQETHSKPNSLIRGVSILTGSTANSRLGSVSSLTLSSTARNS
jgi:hypothetical protein